MKVCIAEKPSVAKDIAEILGANQRKDGYYEGNGYQVTWTFGHLCTLKEPHDYKENWKYWKLEDLPIVPPNFGIKLIQNQGVEKQFRTIERLVQNCNEVINCGDAGQEGELIQRWVLLKAKCKVPVKRLWISSLTEEAIKEGFEKLQDASKYDNLYAAGSARAIGDWMLGINGTRLFTKKFGQGKSTLSIGRVQTPTLAMIVQRHKEIDSFDISEYWELKTVFKEQEFNCQIPRLKSEEKAKNGLEYLKDKEFEITSFEQKEGKEGNPRLYDLTSLQVDANKKHGYSADETLKLIQGLYEKKLVTYPRVDTTYLTEDLHPKIPNILKGLQYYSRFTEKLLQKPIPKSKTVFDDKKVTDHHAIIPTGVVPSGITHAEQNIYDLIVRRFIAVFYPPCIVSNTTVLGKVGDLEFKATGKQILKLGWRELYTSEDKDAKKSKDEEKIMPHFDEGEKGPHEPMIHKGKTSPPKHFTEATLLRAMESAGKQVEDEEMRELMKDNGIGRPSTRANIIETLFRRKYIEKKRKNLVATATGIALIDTIQNELLKSAELTGDWEKKIRLIEKGEYNLDVFKQELYSMVRGITDEVIFNTHRPMQFFKKAPEKKSQPKQRVKKVISFEEMDCPKCKSAKLMKGKSATGCAKFKECGFKVPFVLMGKKLTDNQLKDLIEKKKTGWIKGITNPSNQEKIEGRFLMDDQFNIQFDQKS